MSQSSIYTLRTQYVQVSLVLIHCVQNRIWSGSLNKSQDCWHTGAIASPNKRMESRFSIPAKTAEDMLNIFDIVRHRV